MTKRALWIGLRWASLVLMLGLMCGTQLGLAEGPAIKLIVRGDDMGFSHAANEACIRAYRNGIVRSVEVMVPGPWFPEAVKMLRANPGLDVGVHLTLTSEWENMKWGPISHAPSLTDAEGKFFATTGPDKNMPPKSSFLESGWTIGDVEKELRAQIELAKKLIPNVTHLSDHMGAATSDPRLRKLTQRLAQEYALPLDLDDAQYFRGFDASDKTFEAKERTMVRALDELQPGVWLLIEHPGLDTPEMQAIGTHADSNVAADRDAVTRIFTSERVKQTIATRHIQLISYGDYYRSSRK